MTEPIDYDNPWKEALARYLPSFLELCFPDAYAGIDWQQGYRLLEQELRQVLRKATTGLHRVDLLAQVWRTDGTEAWVLVHIEVQTQRDAGFAKRMWRYHARLSDRYDRPIASFAVLADTDPHWRPTSHVSELWGCTSALTFPTVKLLDLDERLLAASTNPIAVVIRGHLRAQATRHAPAQRMHGKMELIKDLYRSGLAREDVLELLRLLDWLLALPEELENQFWTELETWEAENQMPYVTSWERRGLKRGREEGLQEGLQAGQREGRLGMLQEIILENLAHRHGPVPEQLAQRVRQITDVERLRLLQRASIDVESVDAFLERLPD